MPSKNDKGLLLNQKLIAEQANSLVAELEKLGSQRNRDGMARFAIVSDRIFGVTIPQIRAFAKRVGRRHELAELLWKSGYHEARILATLVDEPSKVTAEQMNRWAHDFDNWAVCDAACMNLFDRAEPAWDMIREWADSGEEYVKRAAFALIASIAQHDKKRESDKLFDEALELIERESTDSRNFVKKAVNWALRVIGKRTPQLYMKAMHVSSRLASSTDRTARWIGKDALKKLESKSKDAD
jgi:3-methyladenine DNA glycosylase AlkD